MKHFGLSERDFWKGASYKGVGIRFADFIFFS